MRRLLLVGVMLTLLANSTGIYFQTSGATTVQADAKIETGLSLNSTLPNPVVASKPVDFTTAFTIPAHAQFVQTTTLKLTDHGFAAACAATYIAAQQASGVPWQLLAAVHKVETGADCANTARASSAGAQGPMQFLPSTFAAYAVDGNGDGRIDINNIDDAIFTAAHYLQAGGAATGNYYGALFNYNHADWYVQKVLGIAGQLGL